MRIQPDEGILLRFAAKVPELGLDVRSVNMDFTYGSSFIQDAPEAYETLILDAMLGDASLFTRADEVEAAWSIVTPLNEIWREWDRTHPDVSASPKSNIKEQQGAEVHFYEAGTWGPAAAERLIERSGRQVAAAVSAAISGIERHRRHRRSRPAGTCAQVPSAKRHRSSPRSGAAWRATPRRAHSATAWRPPSGAIRTSRACIDQTDELRIRTRTSVLTLVVVAPAARDGGARHGHRLRAGRTASIARDRRSRRRTRTARPHSTRTSTPPARCAADRRSAPRRS